MELLPFKDGSPIRQGVFPFRTANDGISQFRMVSGRAQQRIATILVVFEACSNSFVRGVYFHHGKEIRFDSGAMQAIIGNSKFVSVLASVIAS
jgi:hypothetical protein